MFGFQQIVLIRVRGERLGGQGRGLVVGEAGGQDLGHGVRVAAGAGLRAGRLALLQRPDEGVQPVLGLGPGPGHRRPRHRHRRPRAQPGLRPRAVPAPGLGRVSRGEAGRGRQREDEGGGGDAVLGDLGDHGGFGERGGLWLLVRGLARPRPPLVLVPLLLPEDVRAPPLVALARPPLEGHGPPGGARHGVLELSPPAEPEPRAHPEEVLPRVGSLHRAAQPEEGVVLYSAFPQMLASFFIPQPEA